MNKTLRIITLLVLGIVLGVGQAWAEYMESNPRVKFVYTTAHGTAFASGASDPTAREVTITVTPDAGYRCLSENLTANVSTGTEILGASIDVTCVTTNVFTLTLPEDDDKYVTVTINFSEKLTYTPVVYMTNWVYGSNATTPDVSEYNQYSDPPLVFKYGTKWENNALVDEQDYEGDPPVGVGEYYMVAYVEGNADYNASHSEPVKFEIEPKTLTISGSYISGVEKVYDGTTDVELSNVEITPQGVINDDVVEVTAKSGSYASKNVGSGIVVTIGEFELEGSDAGNYRLTNGGYFEVITTGIITVRSICLKALPIITKTYDSGTGADPDYNNAEFDNTIYGDDVKLCYIVANYESRDVGENKKVYLGFSDAVLNGDDYTNYDLKSYGSISETTGDITKAPLTVTAKNAQVKFGNVAPEFSVDYIGFVGDESAEDEGLLSGTLTFDCDYTTSSAVGSYTITPKGLTSSNYEIEFVDGTLKVVPADLQLFAPYSTNLWATYCDNCERTVPDGCTAWTVTGISGNTVTVSEVTGNTMPAYTALLVSRSQAGTAAVIAEYAADGEVPATGYDTTTGLAMSSGTGWSYYGNAGNAATTANVYAIGDTGNEQSYVLNGGQFVMVDNVGTGVAPHRCWLNVSKSNGGNARRLGIGGEVTGIVNGNVNGNRNESEKAAAWYSLDGRRLDKAPTRPGLYIRGGKLVAPLKISQNR